MSSDIITGLIGLFGAFIGALASFLGQFYFVRSNVANKQKEKMLELYSEWMALESQNFTDLLGKRDVLKDKASQAHLLKIRLRMLEKNEAISEAVNNVQVCLIIHARNKAQQSPDDEVMSDFHNRMEVLGDIVRKKYL